MMNRLLGRYLICPLVVLAALSGCQALHSYRPITVQAVDAETKKPIPGAEIRLSYPLAKSSSAPWESVATTGSDGTTQLRAAPYGDAGIQLDASLPGYMSAQKAFPTDAVEAVKKPGLFDAPGQIRPVNFVVEMLAEPFPSVELVIPDGYRGTVKVGVRIKEDAPATPGQRQFSYTVPASGIIDIVGPPLLRRVFTPDFSARFANGTQLNRQPEGDEIGFLCLKSENGYDYFVVGSRADFDALRRADQKEEASQKSSSGGKGGGGRGKHGGGGRGGNQSSADSSQSSLSP
jgi:hypothetical protein